MVHLRHLMAKVRYCICTNILIVHVLSTYNQIQIHKKLYMIDKMIYNNKPKLSFIGMIIEGTVCIEYKTL